MIKYARLVLYVLGFPFFLLYCIGNVIVGESFNGTLSTTAWRKRDHKYWRVSHRVINTLFFFQENHCREAAFWETELGGFWPSYWSTLKYFARSVHV